MKLIDVLPTHERWEKAKEDGHKTVLCCTEHYDNYYVWYYSRMQQLLSDNSELLDIEVIIDSHYQLQEEIIQ